MKIENLLKHEADPSAKDDVSQLSFYCDDHHYTVAQDGNTVLHLAALRRDTETVAIVLRYSVTCINLTNNVSIYSLTVATLYDLPSMQQGNTVLHIACREGLTELVKLLCTKGANVTMPNNARVSCVHAPNLSRKFPLYNNIYMYYTCTNTILVH